MQFRNQKAQLDGMLELHIEMLKKMNVNDWR